MGSEGSSIEGESGTERFTGSVQKVSFGTKAKRSVGPSWTEHPVRALAFLESW